MILTLIDREIGARLKLKTSLTLLNFISLKTLLWLLVLPYFILANKLSYNILIDCFLTLLIFLLSMILQVLLIMKWWIVELGLERYRFYTIL